VNEQRMWQAVVVQQFEDLLSNKELLRRLAKAWFEASVGTSAADFELAAQNAGFQPETVRKAYQIIITSDNPKEVLKNIKRFLEC